MASPSKEENVLRAILENSPLKEWHFENLVKEARVTRAAANKWLRKYSSEGLLKRVKKRGRFPHHTAGPDNHAYKTLKRIYGLRKLQETGLMSGLLSNDKAKTIILFGSFAKGDWYKDSDIDIFVLGELTDFDKKTYEFRLNRNIELHEFRDRKDILKVGTGLIKNVINGYVLKGRVEDIIEVA